MARMGISTQFYRHYLYYGEFGLWVICDIMSIEWFSDMPTFTMPRWVYQYRRKDLNRLRSVILEHDQPLNLAWQSMNFLRRCQEDLHRRRRRAIRIRYCMIILCILATIAIASW